jgi:predicted dehydrogenase
MKVGIIGASGIGKHHAKWFSLAGCDVTTFTGTSDASCRRTTGVLHDLMGFEGKGYTDYREMLDQEALDIVSICSPPEAHLGQIRDALQSGLHVYCEKPVTWVSAETISFPLIPGSADDISSENPALRSLLEETRLALAPALSGLAVFGFNTQYTALHQAYRALYEAHRGTMDKIEKASFILESKGISGRHDAFEGIWTDMSSHALSQLIGWMPDGILETESISCVIQQDQTRARFKYGSAWVETILAKNVQSELRRQFGVNDFLVDYEGKADEQGVYRTFLQFEKETVMMDDLVQLSINRFLTAIRDRDIKPFSSALDALKNLEMSVIILERGVRQEG